MNEKLSMQDLVNLLAEKQGVTKKDAEAFLRELFAVIYETIEQQDFVRIKDFGTFKLTKVSSRKSVDVNTGEDIEIPAHYKLSFSPDKSLRDAVNRPFAHFESVAIEEGVSFENINSEPEQDFDEDIEIVEEENIVPPIVNIDVSTMSDPEPEKENIKIEIVKEPINASVSDTDVKPLTNNYVQMEKETQNTPLTNDSEKNNVEESSNNINIEQEIAKEDQQDDTSLQSKITEEDFMYEIEEEKSKVRWIVLGFVIAILLVCAYIYRDNIFEGHFFKNNEVANEQAEETSSPVIGDESQITENDSTATVEPEINYKPKDVIEIKYGDTLRKIGLRYYGHKSFWVYIYLENPDKIKNFNNVAIGTSLIIPANEKYKIDVNNPESVQKAIDLEKQYLKH